VDANKPRLGRGLDALLGSTPNAAPGTPTTTVPVDKIQPNPFQPRKRFDEDELKQLADSIKVHGVLQPLTVRQVDGAVQLIAGERRLRAAQLAGLAAVPVHMVEFTDQQVAEAALVENIQRTDLNPIEKANGFKEYLDRYKMSHEALATKLGVGTSSVSNLVALLNLPVEVQDAVRLGQLTLGHAKVLKGVLDRDRMLSLAREAVLKGLSVHALEQLAKAVKHDVPEAPVPKPKPPAAKTAHVESLETELRQRLSTRVEIKVKAKDKGQIVIGFDTNDDFERIMDALRK
jgi:ParB family chromosome partitioning protein